MRQYFPHVMFWALEALLWHSSNALDVNWTSPMDGDVYGPGEHIIARWTSNEAITNVSFRLCDADSGSSGNDGNCGQAVQPAVVDDDDGSHQVTLAVPPINSIAHVYLQLFEDPADPATSPVFSLSSSASNSSTSPVSASAASDDTSSSRNTQPRPVTAQSHTPASTAAYAVPLSLAGAIVLFAGVVGVHQRKKYLAERAASEKETSEFKEHFMQKRLRGFTFWNTKSKADHGLPTQEKPDDAYTRMFVPQLHRSRTRGPRQATKAPFATHTTARSVPAAVFRAALSPRMPHTSSGAHAPNRHPSRQHDRTAEINAAVHESVVSHYLQPSPIPSPVPSPIKQAHLRKHSTPDCGGSPFNDMDKLYEEVARRIH